METFGEFLKNQREKKGVRLEEIASITKIHLHTLQYLEDSKWDELPPEPFIRGFIIAYAKYVGLDTHDTIERYALEVGKSKAPPPSELEVISTEFAQPQTTTPVSENAPSKRQKMQPSDLLNQPPTLPLKKFAVGIGVACAVVLILVIGLVGKKNSTDTTAAPKEDVAQTVVAPPVTAPPEVKPPVVQETIANQIQNAIGTAPRVTASEEVQKVEAPKAAPEKPAQVPVPVQAKAPVQVSAPVQPPAQVAAPEPQFAHELVVEGKERSWIKVVVDNKPPKELYTKPGERMVFQATEKIKLVVGNVSTTSVLYNGEKTDGKKYQGTIHFFVFPHGARFPQDPPKRAAASKPVEESNPDSGAVPGMPPQTSPTENQEAKPN